MQNITVTCKKVSSLFNLFTCHGIDWPSISDRMGRFCFLKGRAWTTLNFKLALVVLSALPRFAVRVREEISPLISGKFLWQDDWMRATVQVQAEYGFAFFSIAYSHTGRLLQLTFLSHFHLYGYVFAGVIQVICLFQGYKHSDPPGESYLQYYG